MRAKIEKELEQKQKLERLLQEEDGCWTWPLRIYVALLWAVLIFTAMYNMGWI